MGTNIPSAEEHWVSEGSSAFGSLMTGIIFLNFEYSALSACMSAGQNRTQDHVIINGCE